MRLQLTRLRLLGIMAIICVVFCIFSIIYYQNSITKNDLIQNVEFNPCYHLKEVRSEGYNVTIIFDKPIPKNIQSNINSYFGYQTQAFDLPLVMPPGSSTVLSFSSSTLTLDFFLPFIQNYTGYLVCADPKNFKTSTFKIPHDILSNVDNFLPLNMNIDRFKNEENSKLKRKATFENEWSQMICYGTSYETRYCDMRNVVIYKQIFVFATKADYIFPEPFLTLGARSPPFDRSEGRLIYEPSVIHSPLSEIPGKFVHYRSSPICYIMARFYNSIMLWHTTFDFLVPAFHMFDKFEGNEKNDRNSKENVSNLQFLSLKSKREGNEINESNLNKDTKSKKAESKNESKSDQNGSEKDQNTKSEKNVKRDFKNESKSEQNGSEKDQNTKSEKNEKNDAENDSNSKQNEAKNIQIQNAKSDKKENEKADSGNEIDSKQNGTETDQIISKRSEKSGNESASHLGDRYVFIRDFEADSYPELLRSLSRHKIVSLYHDSSTRKFDRVIVGIEKLETNPSSARPDDAMFSVKYNFTKDTAPRLRRDVLASLSVKDAIIDPYAPLVLIIERKNTNNRLFLNIDEIEEYLLSRCDFCRVKRIEYDKENFTSQVSLTTGASVLIGVHGSGLANVLWMKPTSELAPTALIELFPSGYNCRDWFHGAANVSNVEYYSVMGKKIKENLEKESVLDHKKERLDFCRSHNELCPTNICHDVLRDQNVTIDVSALSSVWLTVVSKLNHAQKLYDK